jgi:predicted transposase YbfD/YdcC
VIELTRDIEFLSGKKKGHRSHEVVIYVCSRELAQIKAPELLNDIRLYWEIEGSLHQSLDVSAKEDSSRVRNRNALQVLGMARRSMMGIYRDWRARRKNKRQSTLVDFYDAMSAHNNRGAWQKVKSPG